MIKKESRDALRRKRHERMRIRLAGTAERPRLSVFRSSKFIYAQVIDDSSGRTLAAASSLESDVRGARASSIRPRPLAAPWPSARRRPASRPWSSTAADTNITGGFARSPRAPARAASTCRAE